MLISKTTYGMAVVAALIAAGSAWADELTDRVSASLRDSAALDGYHVTVKAKDGTVWLTGTVREPAHIAAAVGIAESTPGVERVVNRLAVDSGTAEKPAGLPGLLALPPSMQSLVGLGTPAAADEQPPIQLVAAREPAAKVTKAAKPQTRSTAATTSRTPARKKTAASPRPLGNTAARPIPLRGQNVRMQPRQAVRTSMEGAPIVQGESVIPGEPMMLPSQADYGVVDEGLVDGQMVPGSMRIGPGNVVDGSMAGGAGLGRPMPMGGMGAGMPPVPVRGNGPNMPNYAWPSYAAYPNYAALQYPTQYSPTAWPYIGPFYPYPQVPLGWRRVSLEWDDGWWFLDFDDRHHHSHHR